MSKEAEIQYKAFVENGDLKVLYPSMTGDWEKDKTRFIKIWSEMQELIKNIKCN